VFAFTHEWCSHSALLSGRDGGPAGRLMLEHAPQDPTYAGQAVVCLGGIVANRHTGGAPATCPAAHGSPLDLSHNLIVRSALVL
jgi:hypothetical protein